MLSRGRQPWGRLVPLLDPSHLRSINLKQSLRLHPNDFEVPFPRYRGAVLRRLGQRTLPSYIDLSDPTTLNENDAMNHLSIPLK